MPSAESYSIALGYFPQLLGLVYLLAFASLLVQVKGLYGSKGILPIHELVEGLRQQARRGGWLRFPSIFLINSSDTVLVGSAALGCILSIYLLFGLPPLPALILLWIIYCSFTTMGQEFLSFQWDALLLETGFMTIFLPLANRSSPLVFLAFQLFVFRFMISAGVVKLTSHDPNWRNLRALCFHYETQPIPNRVAWYAHQLPEQFQKVSTLGTFLFELIVPLLALGPAPYKLACFCLLVSFQSLIMLTGNYGFFNILTIVLAVPLLEDRYLSLLEPGLPKAATALFSSPVVEAVFVIFILLNILQLIRLFQRPRWVTRILSLCGRLLISNPYGLFAVMTTERFEFVIEGSRTLKEWLPYGFLWKPGDPETAPRQAAPHQPRLDWQMWFAALNPSYVEPWLSRLIERLLEGSSDVLRLFRHVPFSPAPPEYIRLTVYRYHFTTPGIKRTTGRWWNRIEVGRSEAMSLRHLS
jgi:hypothetical protein